MRYKYQSTVLFLFLLSFAQAKVVTKTHYFSNTEIIQKVHSYEEGILLESKIYNKKGKLSAWYSWEKVNDRSWIKIINNVENRFVSLVFH